MLTRTLLLLTIFCSPVVCSLALLYVLVKMRAISDTPTISPNTFLVMDRLYGTLDDRLEEWFVVQKENQGSSCCPPFGKAPNQQVLDDLLRDRLVIAYDLAAAISYLHTNKLVYRDLKPENCGFDVRGDIKLFDFGLLKSLDPKLKDGDGFKLTAVTGSIPYMAPEVARGKPYGTPADVFSYSILLWEILSLDWAFNGYTKEEFFQKVSIMKERLPISKSWPAILHTLVREGWDQEPGMRPTMQRARALLKGVLEDLSDDQAITSRTVHMLNRSQRSMRGLNSSIGRRTSIRDLLSPSGRSKRTSESPKGISASRQGLSSSGRYGGAT